MGFQLHVTQGPAAGQKYQLKPGLVIGRADVDIIIDDPKVSVRHAKIETAPNGDWVMTDLGSTNGLRVKGKKYSQLTLSPGLVVKLGNTTCEIIEVQIGTSPFAPVDELDDSATLPPIEPTKKRAAKNKNDPPPKIESWSDYFVNFCTRALAKVKSKPQTVKPFKPLVVLKVTHGLQAGTEWVLGYGPRFVGLASLDLPIFDPLAPPTICMIEPKGVSVFFQTEFPDKVKLNGRSVSADMLKAGDEISFAETKIQVSFKE